MLETTITIPAAARGGGRDCGLSLADGGNSPAPPPPALVGHRYCLPLHRQTLKRHAAGTAWPWLPLSALCQSRPHRRCCSCGLEGYLPQSIPADISHSLAALVSNNIAKKRSVWWAVGNDTDWGGRAAGSCGARARGRIRRHALAAPAHAHTTSSTRSMRCQGASCSCGVPSTSGSAHS